MLDRTERLAWTGTPELVRSLALDAADALRVASPAVSDLTRVYTSTETKFRKPEAFLGKLWACTFLPSTDARPRRVLAWVNPVMWTTDTYRVERLEALASMWLRAEAWIAGAHVSEAGLWVTLCRSAGVAPTTSGDWDARRRLASFIGANVSLLLHAVEDRPTCAFCGNHVGTGERFGDKEAHRTCVQAAALRAGVKVML